MEILLMKNAKESKLVEIVATSSYWRSWRPFGETFQPPQTLLRLSMTVLLTA